MYMKSSKTILSAIVTLFWLTGNPLVAQTCEALFTFDNTNLTIHFTDLSTHAPNDPIVSWDWNFDDGGTSTQQNPVHTFPEPDRYDVVLTIQTQNGCTSMLEIRIEICDFDVDYTLGACDPQGMIPVMLDITDLFDNADEISVTLDGQNVPGSPFPISGQNPVNIEVLVPGNGLSHTIMIQSLDIETCGRSITFATEDCTSDCFLSSLQVGYVPGITHDVIVDDNFFSPQSIAIVLGEIVRFNWVGGGHSTTSDATSGADSWNSGVIGAGSTFDVEIQNPGTHNYYCIPHGGQGGVGMSGQILSNCPTGTTMDILVKFNTTVANGQGYNILWDGSPVAGSPFNYNGVGQQSQQISIAGDGMMHTLIVRDVADPTCDVELAYDAPDCGQGGGNPQCSILAGIGNFGVCTNMEVSTDLTVTVANGGLGFELSIDGGPNTFYAYTGNNTTVSVSLPGNGLNHTLLITDEADPACQATLNVVTPDCTLPCGISNLVATPSSGNGDPSGIIHQVNVEDFQFNPDIVSIAAGDVVQWNWVGAIPHTSTSDISGGADSWNSGLLNNGAVFTSPVLSEGTHPYYCIPHGAPGGVGMSGQVIVLPSCNEFGQVLVQVQFNVTNGGAGGYQVVVDGNVAGTFAYAPGVSQSTTVLVAGDGVSHTLTVHDILDVNCAAMTTVVTPNCGGGTTCSVTFNPSVNGGCVNNMVPVLLNVTGSNTDTTYSVFFDGQPAGTFYYTNQAAQINVPGDALMHSIIIVDGLDANCRDTISNITLPLCGGECMILNLTANTSAGIVHTVEVRDFDYFPANLTVGAGEKIKFVWTGVIPHTVTSDALSGPAVWNSGLLGMGAVYELTIDTPGVHPYFCIPHGGPGGIGMSGTITVLPLCTDNTEHVQLRFDVTNGSTQGYNVFVDGMPFGDNPRQYANTAGNNELLIAYPADQMQHIITIQDVINPLCAASDFFTTGSCSADCSISGFDYFLGNGRRKVVQVRDFDFEPAVLQAELGDTIHFVWTGAIPHTVTSDVSQGADVFNSGLLGQGSTFDLVLTTNGMHPYYCIPHGAPGGIGMSGMIEVKDPCDDGKVFVDFEFFSSGPGTAYDVFNQSELLIDNRGYVPGGIQHFELELQATGQSHLIRVMDTGTDTCTAGITLDSFDCSDPCFLVRSDFSYDINYSTLEVAFTEDSRGDVVSWLWNFGDGQTSNLANPTHTFQEAVLYEVCLTVTTSNGCMKTRCDKLRLGAEVCHAGFTFQQDGLTLTFFNTSDVSNSEVGALWVFGDGENSVQFDSVAHTFSLGTYEVCVTVTSPECTHTYCEIIDLSDPCLALRASYMAEPDAENPLLYHFSDLSTGDIGSRLWGFGDGQISSLISPDHLYTSTGVYTVCLLTISTDGNCTNSDCRSLFVGTTGTGGPREKLHRINVVPNPVNAGNRMIQLNGFDDKDLGQLSAITFYNLQGSIANREIHAVEESLLLSTPELPGLYYLEVISATKRYGVMVVVQ
jgi:plastocyanin